MEENNVEKVFNVMVKKFREKKHEMIEKKHEMIEIMTQFCINTKYDINKIYSLKKSIQVLEKDIELRKKEIISKLNLK